jgi:hypothetical protein
MAGGSNYREWGRKGPRPWILWILVAVFLGLIAGWALVH